MADSVEEKKFADHESLHEHHKGCSEDREKTDYVADANDIEDDVARTSQGAFEEWHLIEVLNWMEKSVEYEMAEDDVRRGIIEFEV